MVRGTVISKLIAAPAARPETFKTRSSEVPTSPRPTLNSRAARPLPPPTTESGTTVTATWLRKLGNVAGVEMEIE